MPACALTTQRRKRLIVLVPMNGPPTREVSSIDYPVVLDVAGAGVRGVFWVVVPFLGDIG